VRRSHLLCSFVLIMVAGCVAVENPGNYRPWNSSTQGDYYQCLQEAQQSYASVNANRAYVSAKASTGTNDDLLCSCMTAKGYSPRAATTTETVLGWTLSPLWVPLAALASIGEGMSGQPPQRWIGCPGTRVTDSQEPWWVTKCKTNFK
jgi:hypothetical protein